MIDFKKLRKEFTKILHSYSADDLQEWIDMDRKRMALAAQEESIFQPAAKPRMAAVGKLNASAVNAAGKPTAAKSAPRTAKVKAKKTATVYA